MNCPAVRSYCDGYFVIASPFSLQLRFQDLGGAISIAPVYPFTSLVERKVQEFLTVEPLDTWRGLGVAALQFPSPYVFVADQPLLVEQSHPMLGPVTSMNWRVIPGRFDIYAWQRPLNWAIEWDTSLGDLRIRAGDPLYSVRFLSPDGGQVLPVELVECRMTPELTERIALARGVTAVRRGVTPLIERARQDRSGMNLIQER